jgi:hypothetical protein
MCAVAAVAAVAAAAAAAVPQMADEAVCIGEAPSSESYLNVPNLLAAAVSRGAQAVHPVSGEREGGDGKGGGDSVGPGGLWGAESEQIRALVTEEGGQSYDPPTCGVCAILLIVWTEEDGVMGVGVTGLLVKSTMRQPSIGLSLQSGHQHPHFRQQQLQDLQVQQ